MKASAQVSNDNEDGVYKIERHNARDFVPGQVIVKFKDNSIIQVRQTTKGKYHAANINVVDKLLREYNVDVMEKLFPTEMAKPKEQLRKKVAPNGTIVQERNLDKVFLIKLRTDRADSTMMLIERLKNMDDVEYAEPNYLAYITADMPTTFEEMTYPFVNADNPRRVPVSTETDFEVICSNPNQNPLYSYQYGIIQQRIHQLWDKPIINKKRPVIAILDTGVDINHPDLKDNIWTNTSEAEGETAYDDDGNGIVDDKYGWNFVEDYYDLTDHNGHGTHVAGIAAAADNGIGIVGANPLALILPVKVMNDNGIGNHATIARGIVYATDNGAEVLNMSFGTSKLSNTMKDALDRAFQTSILVASAGNNGKDIYDKTNPSGTSYPAAYYLVLGVESSTPNSNKAAFSNYDPDGPIYSEDGIDGRNYEVQVPGVDIYSTLPNGKYGMLNGTSMSAPLFAGAVSALQMVKNYPSKDVLIGDLIHLQADFEKIYSDDTPRMPKIDLVSLNVDDNVEGNTNIDGQIDVGEIIKFYPVLRNTWADATDINLKLTVDSTYASFVEIDNPEMPFGYSISAYGHQMAKTPISVRFGENIGDNTRIQFSLEVSYSESTESFVKDVFMIVNNKNILSGIINKDTLLTSNKTWYWEKIYLKDGSTITIEPGTRIVSSFDGQMYSQIDGKIICQGTVNAPIIIDYSGFSGLAHYFSDETRYCYFRNVGDVWNFRGFSLDMFNWDYEKKYHTFNHCVFDKLSLDNHTYEGDDFYVLNNCIFAVDGIDYNSSHIEINSSDIIFSGISYSTDLLPNIQNCNSLSGIIAFNVTKPDTLYLPNNVYHGTSSEKILSEYARCYPEFGWGIIDYSNMRKTPFAEAHGIVWKVVVNGKDAQDEYEDMTPLGVGKHKFEVYFNRPMNKEVTPQISFGVHEPYTQHVVDEDGSWNEEGTIYTAYKTISGKTMSDGVNRIYVYGAEDNEYFECPYEKTRFNINIQAAGSMAIGFAAEAKMGRVKLTWNNEENDFDDAMGFNIYRYTLDEVGKADTIRINQEIVDIETTEYTDYDVVPGQTYYYLYKVLSTDLKEYDVSNVVAVTPLTSQLGDANGSGDVDVADVITTVNYAAGQEPKPFIFEAADMNADQQIDILDVIGIIQIIIQSEGATSSMADATAIYTIENGVLYVESPVALAGVQAQLNLSDNQSDEACFKVAKDLNGFEHTSAWLSDNDYLFLAYNMNGKTLTPGKHALLYIGNADLSSLRLSDTSGHNVIPIPGEGTPTLIDMMGSKVIRQSGVFNLKGQKVASKETDMNKLPNGVYIVNGEKVIK